MVKRYIYITITIMILTSCGYKRIIFIDIEKQLDLITSNQVVKDSSFLKNGIYLNTDFYPILIASDSSRLRKEVFIIDEKDKIKVSLSKNYRVTKEVIEPIDIKLIEFFQDKFGIDNPGKQIFNRSLVYKNRIFVEFINDLGVNAFVFELIERNVLVVEIAFILAD
ncbi:MAG: hypothetical protein KA023_10175 [Bacteroidales bacterium]|jgi:hypothetical protein|nr:hypothetical protein [Bacteroidales bacterium]MBP7875138.1 hypothetical protein [Bacteroidales bacterium]MCZ2283142.1 hypothetical protein [Bacteroidales bacterium]